MSLDFQPVGSQRRLGLPLSLGPRPWKRDMGIGLILAVLMTMPIFML